MNEQKLTTYLWDFFCKYDYEKIINKQEPSVIIEQFVSKLALKYNDSQELKLALTLQAKAYEKCSEFVLPFKYDNLETNSVFLLIFIRSYPPLIFGLIISLIFFPLFPHFMLIQIAVGCIFFAITGLAGLLVEISEVLNEIIKNQRILANIVTLALSASCIAAASFLVASIFASNPVFLAIIFTSLIIFATAVLVTSFRTIVNKVDSFVETNSSSKNDSRFKLTENDIVNLKNQGYEDEDITKIKAIIRGLALKSKKTFTLSFFGTDSLDKDIVKLVHDVKKGNIPKEIAEQFDLKFSASPIVKF